MIANTKCTWGYEYSRVQNSNARTLAQNNFLTSSFIPWLQMYLYTTVRCLHLLLAILELCVAWCTNLPKEQKKQAGNSKKYIDKY